MAVDEVLLESAAENGQCTLRFYQWSEPTLSLGYFQHFRERRRHIPSRDCPVVRRQDRRRGDPARPRMDLQPVAACGTSVGRRRHAALCGRSRRARKLLWRTGKSTSQRLSSPRALPLTSSLSFAFSGERKATSSAVRQKSVAVRSADAAARFCNTVHSCWHAARTHPSLRVC